MVNKHAYWNRHNFVGVIGLIACAAIVVLDCFDNAWLYGPHRVISIPRLDATLVAQLASTVTDNADATRIATFWLFLVLRPVLVAVFAAAFWARTAPSVERSASVSTTLLALQILIALMGPTQLVHIVALELGIVLCGRFAWVSLGSLMAADVASKLPYFFGAIGDLNTLADHRAVIMCIAWDVVLHPVFFCIGSLLSAEKRIRDKLIRAHAELLATQQLLADTVRTSERARIARDLHDALGHNLTAMNLHLDLAMRQAGGHDTESLRISRELAQSLLAEIRGVVSQQRKHCAIDLRKALTILCADIPRPLIALSYDESLEISEPIVANAIFRSVQEAITNAVRHSGAAAVRVDLSHKNDGLAVSVSDNGKGTARVAEGNGLSGIRERVEALGGRLQVASCAQRGFSLNIWLPRLAGAP